MIDRAKRVYPFTKLLLRTLTLLSGEKIEWLKKETAEPQTDKTIIFVNTHRFKPDIEKITIKTKPCLIYKKKNLLRIFLIGFLFYLLSSLI